MITMPTDQNNPTTAVAEAFTAISDHYASHFVPALTGTHYCFQKRLNLVMELTKGRTGSFLDCAIGPAEITTEVLRREKFDPAIVVDISPAMVSKATQRLNSQLPAEHLSAVSFLTGDVFEVLPQLRDRKFDLIFCLGLIAHTGRLEELLTQIKSVLSPTGQIVLQSTLLNHPGTKITRFFSAKRYTAKHGYKISYFTNRDIKQACQNTGLKVVQERRFCVGFPFGDRIWARANYWFEKTFSSLASKSGSEALYLIEHDRPQ